MVFCDKCGAYIPDGQTKCLSCGYDENEERKEATEESRKATQSQGADGSVYYSFSNEELKAKLEEQRKKQREANKRWAEQEKIRREAEKRETTAHYYYEETPNDTTRKGATQKEKNRKLFSLLSYLGPLFLLTYFFDREDSFSVYHAKQGAVLFLYGIISEIIGWIPLIGFVARALYYYGIYKGIRTVLKGRREPLPWIGQIAERF